MTNATPLWTATDAVTATRGAAHGQWRAFGVSIDSRTVTKGDLFIAISGPQFDGHDYAVDALDKGAAAVVLHKRPIGLPIDAPTLEVADTTQALIDLGAAARARSYARVVGVTGSVGKTGIKDILFMTLARQAATHATVGNLNNEFGLPLTLARMPRDARYAVLEMGMSHPGELTELSKLARPHVAVISTIAAAHSEFFNGLDAIADAKAEIFSGLEPHGVAVLNRDNEQFNQLATAARNAGVEKVISFGRHADAQVRADRATPDSAGTQLSATVDGVPLAYRIGIPGGHWIINSLAVLAAVDAVGADLTRAANDLADAQAPTGRGERHQVPVENGTFTLIDESYNANPASMVAALAMLGDTAPGAGGRRIAVLGDMLELGPDTPTLHLALVTPIADADVDLIFTTGPAMGTLSAALPAHYRATHAADPMDLAQAVTTAVRPGDVVMVKGSAGSRTGLIVHALLNAQNGGAAANGEPIAC